MQNRIPACLLLVALAGCTVGPDHVPPRVAGETGTWADEKATSAFRDDWIASLGDAELSRLVGEAVRRNADVRIAGARVREARALRDAAAGRRLPQVDATAAATRVQVSENGQLPVGNIPGFDRSQTILDVGFDASWEIDLWGRNSRAIEAADARLGAAEEDARATAMAVAAEMVSTYADLRGAEAALAAARAGATARADAARLATLRRAAGEVDARDPAAALAAEETDEAEVPRLEATIAAARNGIALLAGRPPEDLGRMEDRPQLPLAELPLGLRSDVLRRRPDVVRAERLLAASTAEVGVATADLFPRISLLGSLGQQAHTVGDLASGDSTRFSIGPSLRWPILSFGRIRAQIRAADARAEAAAAGYEKAVLTALSESETAATAYERARTRVASLDEAARQARVGLALAERRQAAGETDLLEVAGARAAASLALLRADNARTEAVRGAARLFKALGGGWLPGADFSAP